MLCNDFFTTTCWHWSVSRTCFPPRVQRPVPLTVSLQNGIYNVSLIKHTKTQISLQSNGKADGWCLHFDQVTLFVVVLLIENIVRIKTYSRLLGEKKEKEEGMWFFIHRSAPWVWKLLSLSVQLAAVIMQKVFFFFFLILLSSSTLSVHDIGEWTNNNKILLSSLPYCDT